MSALFPALLRYWRTRRGLSQLELALEASVTARHLSFLETGRARPSQDMVLRLFSALDAPLRAHNEALVAAGFTPHFPEPPSSALPPEVDAAISHMLRQHEPFPMMAVMGDGEVVRANRAAQVLFEAFCHEPTALPRPLNLYSLLFDPRLLRPAIRDWHALGRGLVSRLHRERLSRPAPRLEALIERLLAYPEVPRAWRHPDFSTQASPTMRLELARGELSAGFLIAVTVFSAPQQVTLEEPRLEACFPLGEATAALCARLGDRAS